MNYETAYQSLPEKLAEQFKDLSFENHCYLRIALDNMFQAKWDKRLRKPAYKCLSKDQLAGVVSLLKQYQTDKMLLLEHNQRSIEWRREEEEDQLKLF